MAKKWGVLFNSAGLRSTTQGHCLERQPMRYLEPKLPHSVVHFITTSRHERNLDLIGYGEGKFIICADEGEEHANGEDGQVCKEHVQSFA